MNILESARRWIWAIVALLAVVAIIAGMFAWNARKQTRAANDATTQAQGRTVSAVEAIDKIGDLGERNLITDNQVEKAHDAIRKADPVERDAVARRQLECLQRGVGC